MADMDPKGLLESLKEYLKSIPPTQQDIIEGFANMVGGAEELSKSFGIGRQRIVEMEGAITKATPLIAKLGGNLGDVVNTMKDVGEATRRNVVAGAEEVSKLYAASNVLGERYKGNMEGVISSFQEIGVEFTGVGSKLEESIQYIQSVGGNVEKIMGTVLDDMSAMNRFNFQDGVVGMTKMAAQAAMLKTDMRVTMELAEKALDPDGAIELASAFQRLGVSASDLTDPFTLMNKSLNDPEGLQNSIVNMSKQFAYFDEKANQFKINPQGMLMMRELQKQTGLSSAELSKMALNAAELDKKLSQISPEIQFAKEEDKNYLANIAKMGDGGKYVISMDDKDVELEKLSQEQINKLIEEQKKGPKTVEDLQRAQTDAIKVMKNDVQEIKDRVVYGLVSQRKVRENTEGLRGAGTAFTGAAVKVSPELETIRAGAEKSMDAVKSFVSSMSKGEFLGKDSMKQLESHIKNLVESSGKLDEGANDFIKSFLELNKDNNYEVGKILQDFVKKEYDESDLKKRVEGKQISPANVDQSGEIKGEIKTSSSSIISRIDVVDNKIDGISSAQKTQQSQSPIDMGEIVRELKTISTGIMGKMNDLSNTQTTQQNQSSINPSNEIIDEIKGELKALSETIVDRMKNITTEQQNQQAQQVQSTIAMRPPIENTSGIVDKIETMSANIVNKLNNTPTAQPVNSTNQPNTENVRELTASVANEGRVTVRFDNTIEMGVKISTDGKVDMAMIKDNLFKPDTMEQISMEVQRKFEQMNISPIVPT